MKQTGTTKLSSLFKPAEILCDTPLKNRDELILEMLKTLAYQRGIGNVDDVFNAVIEREKMACTIMAAGIAMPHARLNTINSLMISVATSRDGVDFCLPGSMPVHLVILVLVPHDSPAAYLQAASSLARIFTDPDVAIKLSRYDNAADIWRFFDRGGLFLPDYICAGDIMEKGPACLRENDNLEQAIDAFVKYGQTDLPVVDDENNLVGVVSAYELLRICMPDYLLWMDDLTPVINFEPFAEILKNESKTWLSDIMSSEYKTVAPDTPAVQVAREISRSGAREVFVVNDHKLVGTISLQHFVSKVLRD